MKKKFYIGLATNFHDPAVALVGPTGQVVFAEAVERPVQDKRALGYRADQLLPLTEMLKEYCDPDAEIVTSTCWSGPFTSLLRLGALFGQFSFHELKTASHRIQRTLLPKDVFKAAGALIYGAQQEAGIGVLLAVSKAFGHRNVTLRRYPHHRTHAVYACRTSPFTEATCLVVDGRGEVGSHALFNYKDGRLISIRNHFGPESIGFFFDHITSLCGFNFARGEQWKVMGLAPYGEPDTETMELVRRLCNVVDGRIKVPGKRTLAEITNRLATKYPASRDDPLKVADLAFAGQKIFEENMSYMVDMAAALGNSENLVLCGGCALNSTFNGNALRSDKFKTLYVPAAPADDGNAIGAALSAYSEDHPDEEWSVGQVGGAYPYLGSPLSEIAKTALLRHGFPGQIAESAENKYSLAAEMLDAGKIVAWINGRAEFGPRALGNRSILADPRDAEVKNRLNSEVKYREGYRPFAPSVLDEHGEEYFEEYRYSPYMTQTLRFRSQKQSLVPGVVHVDGTGRVQSVRPTDNRAFHALLMAFFERTGIPMLLNTSCNIMHKPIIHSVEDAIALFQTTGIDAMFLDDIVITKPGT